MVRINHPISESLIQNEKNEKREKISLELPGKYTQINVEGHVYTNKYCEIKDTLSGDESSSGSSSEDNIVITRRTRESHTRKNGK